jgi:hypothetical protein
VYLVEVLCGVVVVVFLVGLGWWVGKEGNKEMCKSRMGEIREELE